MIFFDCCVILRDHVAVAVDEHIYFSMIVYEILGVITF